MPIFWKKQNMKNTQILVLFVIGAVLIVGGALLKIMDLPFADFLLIIGMTFEGVSFLFLILKMFQKKGPDSFMDS